MKEIQVKVETGRMDVLVTVAQQTKVSEVIAEAVKQAGYDADGTYALQFGDQILEPQRPLVSYHIESGTVLILTDGGGGAAAIGSEVAAAYVSSEVPHLIRLGEGKWTIHVLEPTVFRVHMKSPIDGEPYILEFRCDGYRGMPPYIDFVDPIDSTVGIARAYPKSADGWFHSTPCICKPFSRKAYSAVGGPHGDWKYPDWVRNSPNLNTLGDILLGIYARITSTQLYQGPMQPRPKEA